MSTAIVNRKATGYFEMPTAREGDRILACGCNLQIKAIGRLGLTKILVEIGYGHKSVSSNKILAAFITGKPLANIQILLYLMSVYFFSYAINGIKNIF